MDIKPIASVDGRTISTQKVQKINIEDVVHLQPFPLSVPDVGKHIKELSRMAGFFVLNNERLVHSEVNGDMRQRDVTYGVEGEYEIDDYPQAEMLDISRTHLASMASMAIDHDERIHIAQGRIIAEWERPSNNNVLSAANLHKTIIAFDRAERENQLDLYIARTDETAVEVSVFRRQAANGAHLFPYDGGPLKVEQFGFDRHDGLKSGYYPYPLPALIAAEAAPLLPKKMLRRVLMIVALGLFLVALLTLRG